MKLPPHFEIDVHERFPHLTNAPIVEAVIQWVARADSPLAPDDFRRQLVERLPDYPECHPLVELSLDVRFEEDRSSRHLPQNTLLGFRLISADKLHIAQFSRDGVVFSRLKPYGDWESFSSKAMRVWKVFIEVAQPPEVQRLAVRFINLIAPIAMSDLATYLKRPPKALDSVGLPITNFLWQSRHEVPGRPFGVNVIQTLQPAAAPQTDGLGLILDIDAFTTQAISPTDELVVEHLAKMRWLKDKAFFSLLNASAVKRFQGDFE
jgi:uncharacterized protein (TIGR04255 family)